MLDFRMSLNPFGTGKGVRELARIRIANVTFDLGDMWPPKDGKGRDHYIYYIQEPASRFGEAINAWGVVDYYDRNQPVTCLLARTMDRFDSGFGEEAWLETPEEFRQRIKDIWKD